MPVTASTGTALPITGAETPVVTLAGGPFDNISCYFQGGRFGGGGPLLLTLYALVAGQQTRVASKQVMGSANPSLIAWETSNNGTNPALNPSFSANSRGAGQTEIILNAGGTAYMITVLDLSSGLPIGAAPRQAVTVTLAGVNQYDTVPDTNQSATFTLVPGQTGIMPFIPGWAQFLDVAVDQSQLPSVLVRVLCDCANVSPGALQATFLQAPLSGVDTGLAPVFRRVPLPIAGEFQVQITNTSNQNVTVTLTAATSSVAVTAGGAVILNGDVTGPSNTNTDIKWSNQPLNRVGVNSFAAPTDGAIPIFNAGAAPPTWFAVTLTGDVSLTDAGVTEVTAWLHIPLNVATMGAPAVGDVPIFNLDGSWHAGPIAAAIVLGGDVIGPASANTDIKWFNEPLLQGPAVGQFDLASGGPADAAIPIFDTATAPPTWRALVISGDGTIDHDGVLTVTGGTVTLTGNTNGPSNANVLRSFNIENVSNTDVLAAAFVPADGEWYVGMIGIPPAGGNLNVNIPVMPTGAKVTIKDEDGSLNFGTITLIPAGGKTIDGAATYVMNLAQNGAKGSVTIIMNGRAPTEWQLV